MEELKLVVDTFPELGSNVVLFIFLLGLKYLFLYAIVGSILFTVICIVDISVEQSCSSLEQQLRILLKLKKK